MAQGQVQIDPGVLKTLFMGTAVRRSQLLASQAFSAAGPMIFIIPNAGVGRLVRVLISGTLTATTAVMNTGFRWPYSLFNLVFLTDPLGVNRIQAKAYWLHRLMFYKRYGLYKPFNTLASQLENATQVQGASSLITTPMASVAGGIATSATAVAGFFDLPIALGPTDPRGAFRLDVANGQTSVTLNPSSTLQGTAANIDLPLSSATGTIGNFGTLNVQLVYYYYDPVTVNVGNQPIIPYPVQEMSLVHELLTTTDPAGLVAGAEKLTTLATGREYYRVLQNFSNSTTFGFGQALLSRRRFLIDGNIPTIDENIQAYLSDYLEMYGTLPPDTEVMFNFIDRPWDANRYGQLQTSLFVSSGATVNAGAQLETLRETLYQVAQVPA